MLCHSTIIVYFMQLPVLNEDIISMKEWVLQWVICIEGRKRDEKKQAMIKE